MFGYIAAIFLGPLIPLVLYVTGRRRSPFRRFHAATALNLSLTGLLYALCCLILCGLLLLDSLAAALIVAIPIALVIWLLVLKYLIRGIGAAHRGERYEVPAWICAPIAKPLRDPVRVNRWTARVRPGHSVSMRVTVSASRRPRLVSTIRPAA